MIPPVPRHAPHAWALFGVLALLTAAPPASARDWYVRKTGIDLLAINLGPLGLQTNLLLIGTNLQPFRTLEHTALFVGPGDRVFVGPGTYWDVEISGGNDAANPVLWRPEAPGTVVLRGSALGRSALTVQSSAGHVFRDFAFKPFSAATDATVMLANSSSIELDDCVCDGGRWGVVLYGTTAALTDYTYAGAGDGAYCFDGSDLTATGCDVTVTDAVHSGFFADDSRLTLTDCTVSGGQNGVRYESGPGATVTDCTITDAVFGLLLQGDAAVVEGCDLLGCATGLHLPAGGGPTPVVRETTIRNGVVGLSTGRGALTLDQVTITGHTNAAIRVATATPAFTLDAADTVDASGNAVGLAWDGDPGLAQSLTVDQKDWTDNPIHIHTNAVEAVDLRNLSLANGETGLLVEHGAAVVVRDSRFSDHGAPADDGAGADVQAASVSISGCTFERGHVGLRLQGANAPDLRTTLFQQCGGAGLELRGGSWTWTAADGLTFDGNHVGAFASDASWTIDGGASGVEIVGPGAVPGSRGLIAVGGDGLWQGVTVSAAASGFEILSPTDVRLENCTASGCSDYGLYVERGPGQTAPRPVAALDFAAIDCGVGVGVRRGADAAPGVGEIELRRVTVVRTTAVDADGYAVAPTGTGLYLDHCPLDPALHTDLTISGCEFGVDVRGRDATVDGAMNLLVERCGTALAVAGGALTIADWTNAANHRAVTVAAGSHPVALSNCQLTSRDESASVQSAGPFSATGCTFASQTADALRLDGAPGAAFDATLTDCTVAAAGADGFHVAADPAFGGSVAFLRCATLATKDAGLSVSACDTATVADCVMTNCRGDGYQAVGGDAVFQNCSAASVGGAGFRLIDGSAVELEDCTVEDFAAESGAAGFSLVRCGDAVLNRCAAAFGLGDGLSLHDGGTGPYPDGAFRARVTNVLAREAPCGVRVGAACTATLRHLTTDVDGAGLHVAGGAATAINSLFVGGTHGVRRDAGTLALDHVLLHGPTPAAGALPGPNDLFADPRFRDAAAGDLRLAAGSPAINAGRDLGGAVDDDLTGAPRPSFGRCELGAYEYLEAAGTLRILRWQEVAN